MKFAVEATFTVKISATIDAPSQEEAEDQDFQTLLFLAGRYGNAEVEREAFEVAPLPDDHDPVALKKFLREIG